MYVTKISIRIFLTSEILSQLSDFIGFFGFGWLFVGGNLENIPGGGGTPENNKITYIYIYIKV